MTDDKPLTMSVPEAGKKYFNLSKNASYDAAARGEIPVIPVGRLLRVPIRAMERILDNVDKQPERLQQRDRKAAQALMAKRQAQGTRRQFDAA